MTNYLNQTKDIFNDLQVSFQEIEMSLDLSHKYVDLSMDIPKQTGLDFDINLNLQTDELHISTGFISCSFFPMKDQKIVDLFIESVRGIINGKYRIVKFLDKKERLIKSQLQKPENDEWTTVFTDRKKFSLPFAKYRKVIIKNTVPNIK